MFAFKHLFTEMVSGKTGVIAGRGFKKKTNPALEKGGLCLGGGRWIGERIIASYGQEGSEDPGRGNIRTVLSFTY